jgi:hypothetical protein
MAAEVGRDGEAIAAHGKSQKNQARERKRLCDGEDVLQQGAELHAEDIHTGKEEDDNDAGQIRGVDADLHVAQHHGPKRNGRNMRDVPEPVRA